jgi:EAL domain-containing protein (putative c-di-GMP-specific phosphodiesterase class I)/CheY-like chemotaxis protein
VKIAELSVLVVEDHDFQRETLVDMLKHMEARHVFTASDGKKALDLLAQLRAVDLIICDIEMPTMDGLEFIRRIGQAGYRGSVIIASSLDPSLLSAAETMTNAYGINLLGAMSKPITPPALEAILLRHVPAAPVQQARPRSRAAFTVDEILEGLQENQFEPFFQPKVELATRRVVGAEALARWRHPQQGIVLPAMFVKVLEDAGKIDELMWIMLRKGVAFGSTLQAAGMESSVAVNVSLKSLGNFDLANRVSEIVRGHNLEPSKICLEITETAASTNVGAALENLSRLRMKGYGLSIDDYGTGYSTMQQLTRIPFTELKIDQSFVTNAAANETAKVILSSSLELARKLKVKAVAEGVETEQDWDVLQELGCDLAQGFFIARPMDAKAYLYWLRNLATDPTSMFTA